MPLLDVGAASQVGRQMLVKFEQPFFFCTNRNPLHWDFSPNTGV